MPALLLAAIMVAREVITCSKQAFHSVQCYLLLGVWQLGKNVFANIFDTCPLVA